MKKDIGNAESYSQNYIFKYRNAPGLSGLQIEWVTGGTGRLFDRALKNRDH